MTGNRGSQHPRTGEESQDFMRAEMQGINRWFYGARPFVYLRQRVLALMAMTGAPAHIEAALAEGITIGELVSREDESDKDDKRDLTSDEARASFLTTESEVLAHHVGETLLRLYLAHEGVPACPAWEMAKVQRPGDFKRRVEKRFKKADAKQDLPRVAEVFFGAADVSTLKLEPIPPEGCGPDPQNVEYYLRHFAEHILEHANAYNAAKHGLAVKTTRMSMRLGDGSLLSRDGETISYLEKARNQTGDWQWQMTTTWIEADCSLAFSMIACNLIEQLWNMARNRYSDIPIQKFNSFDKPKYADILEQRMKRCKTGIEPQGISRSLFCQFSIRRWLPSGT